MQRKLEKLFNECTEKLKTININRYRQLISAVMRKCKFLPKIADFTEVNIEEPYTNKQEETQKIECSKCKGTGYILYTKTVEDGYFKREYTYAALCTCGNATQYRGWEITDKRNRTSQNSLPHVFHSSNITLKIALVFVTQLIRLLSSIKLTTRAFYHSNSL